MGWEASHHYLHTSEMRWCPPQLSWCPEAPPPPFGDLPSRLAAECLWCRAVGASLLKTSPPKYLWASRCSASRLEGTSADDSLQRSPCGWSANGTSHCCLQPLGCSFTSLDSPVYPKRLAPCLREQRPDCGNASRRPEET